jgi:hypothetical protein
VSLGTVAKVVGVEKSTVLMWERRRFFPAGANAAAYVALLHELRETTDRARRVRA